MIGPQVKPGYQSTITYHNESVLATVCAAMGLSPCPGAARDAAPMADFFQSDSGVSASTGVVITTPGGGATVVSPVQLIATASENQPISQTQVWDNGTKLGVFGTQIDATFSLAPGQHTTTVLDLDTSYSVIHQSTVTYTVQAPAVQVTSPTPEESISLATVHVVAHAAESAPVSLIEVWDNDVELGSYPGTVVNQYFRLSPGPHKLTVRALDDDLNFLHQTTVPYSVR